MMAFLLSLQKLPIATDGAKGDLSVASSFSQTLCISTISQVAC